MTNEEKRLLELQKKRSQLANGWENAKNLRNSRLCRFNKVVLFDTFEEMNELVYPSKPVNAWDYMYQVPIPTDDFFDNVRGQIIALDKEIIELQTSIFQKQAHQYS